MGLNIGEIPINLAEGQNQGKGRKVRNPGKCMAKEALIPSMTVISSNIRDRIQCMSDHSLIGKFVGL